MKLLTRLAGRFVAGETASEAVAAVRALERQGLAATLNYLGEEVLDAGAARRARDEYLGLLRLLRDGGAKAHLSVKLSQLGLKLDPALARDNLAAILEEAARGGAFVRLDMEGSAYTQKTLDLHAELVKRWPELGVVIQAALRRSEADVRALDARGAMVRLCKGAYKEPPEVALQERREVGRSFDRLAGELLAHGRLPAFATHDDERVEFVLREAAALGVPRDGFEFQLLLGLRPRLWRRLLNAGCRVRVYVPYGTHCVGYLWRRLRERRENLAFLVRSLFKG